MEYATPNMAELEKLNLTELEKKFMISLISKFYEEGFSDVDIKDIAKDLQISTSILRGVQSSLIKKEIFYLPYDGDKGVDKACWGVIYLDPPYDETLIVWPD